ncbi:probable ATP-dependent RNA helicase DDX52 [Parasteatoda tepidariorum]|uniref:probable ATP-dependent RNA helicase DDX52 n=1 Tax=Parasteatoda tepidariorum TaxID=114398 RepID=UPI001C722C7C|nr:probable ATP-dependent RNA helicase DDX52 [Parasteatoda tepidariorum]
MERSLELFKIVAFGTSFDPCKPRRRENKLKNAKRNKKKKFEELNASQNGGIEEKRRQEKEISSSDSSDSSSDEEEGTDKEKTEKPVKKKEKKRLSAMQLIKIRKEEVTHFRRVNKIYVVGDDVPDPMEAFDQLISDYDVSPLLLENIMKLNYSKPTPIQMQAVPLMIHNRQLLACAPTGSGKTAAFLIPLIHNLKGPVKGGIRAVVLAPTRELAKQIHSFCIKLSEGTGLRSLIIEDVNSVKERPKYLKKHDILISTPNRLIYLLQNDPPVISLNKVQWLVVDECDKLFETGEKGFRDQLATIYNACDSAELKRAMYSATFSHEVEEWCKLNLDSLVCVAVGSKNTAVETIKQELKFTGSEGGKLVALKDILKGGFMPPALIFVQSKERAKELYSEVVYYCQRVGVIHADLPQDERDSVVEKFESSKIWVLICTELMARGIDFKGVNLVINYDFPATAIAYIHRIGRTGRAGEEGKAITFFTTDDVENLKSIAQVIKNAGCEVPSYIMSLKTKKKKKNDIVRPIKREKISTSTAYDIGKVGKKRDNKTFLKRKGENEPSREKKKSKKTDNSDAHSTKSSMKKKKKKLKPVD